MSRDQKNAYWCDTCKGYVVTIDRDDGVTPMFLACRVKGEPADEGNDCEGLMRSMMYPPEPWPALDDADRPIPTEPTYEWYKPTSGELNQLSQGVGGAEIIEHVNKGGLMLRPIAA